MKKLLSVALLPLVLVACGEDKAVTQEGLISAIKNAGVSISDVVQEEKDPNAIVPQSFTTSFSFAIDEVAPKGGIAFVCDEKELCDPIYQYYDALRGLAGPFIYQSDSGKAVFQLNSGLSPATAKKIENILGDF